MMMQCLRRTLLLRNVCISQLRFVRMDTLQTMFTRWTSRVLSRRAYTSNAITDEEDPANYRKGGYHPVCLDEVFNDRYQVLSKLGHGIYSTVWLAKDLE